MSTQSKPAWKMPPPTHSSSRVSAWCSASAYFLSHLQTKALNERTFSFIAVCHYKAALILLASFLQCQFSLVNTVLVLRMKRWVPLHLHSHWLSQAVVQFCQMNWKLVKRQNVVVRLRAREQEEHAEGLYDAVCGFKEPVLLIISFQRSPFSLNTDPVFQC